MSIHFTMKSVIKSLLACNFKLEAATGGNQQEKLALKISQNSQEDTCVGVYF